MPRRDFFHLLQICLQNVLVKSNSVFIKYLFKEYILLTYRILAANIRRYQIFYLAVIWPLYMSICIVLYVCDIYVLYSLFSFFFSDFFCLMIGKTFVMFGYSNEEFEFWIWIWYISHIPDLLWNQNRVYGLVWDAVVPTNEGVPVAGYDFMAVWTLYCMYQPYWVCGSKGYLVHKAHIPPAVELKVAYMVKFGIPSFPQTRASPWQIMILWQLGSCTVCTSHIGSLGQRAIWYRQLIYPLLWNEKSRIWQSLRCPRSHNQGGPWARF